MALTLSSFQSLAQLGVAVNFGFSAVATFVLRHPTDERQSIEQAKIAISRLAGDASNISAADSAFLAERTMRLDQLSSELLKLGTFQDRIQGHMAIAMFFVLSLLSFGFLVYCSEYPEQGTSPLVGLAIALLCIPPFGFTGVYVLVAIPLARRVRRDRQVIELEVARFLHG